MGMMYLLGRFNHKIECSAGCHCKHEDAERHARDLHYAPGIMLKPLFKFSSHSLKLAYLLIYPTHGVSPRMKDLPFVAQVQLFQGKTSLSGWSCRVHHSQAKPYTKNQKRPPFIKTPHRLNIRRRQGYVASWLVMRLLQHGYTVRATVRSHPEHKKKDISYLTSLPGAAERLQIFNADLELPDSFLPAVEGCAGVFHVAHPIDFEGREENKALNQKALRGTLGVLRACVAAKTVRRVVYTSSSSAVMLSDAAEDDEEVVDESRWSDVELVKKVKPYGAPYFISKIVCERAATQFAEENGLDLVSVVPSLVGGPFITPQIPSSVRLSMALIFGEIETYEFLIRVSMVHIDDLANAFILLYEHSHAHGRYNCSAVDVRLEDLSKLISTKYPQFQVPSPDTLKDVKGFKPKFLSSKKILDLGFKFKYGLHEIYDNQIKCCIHKGLLKTKKEDVSNLT